jgi:hypothetical protein
LFDDVSSSKLSDEWSRFSIATADNLSSIKKVPYTKFFGFNPMERSGFLVQMNNPNSSLYPLLDPRLTPDDVADIRFGIEGNREKVKRQRTTDDVGKYAPKTLGGIFWSDGTNTGTATLGNQVPWMKVKSEGYGSTYFRKYEKLAKDSTDGLGYLTKWANTRRSPSELDKQYSKYKLQDESVNKEIAVFNQPFVVRGIQRVGEVENQRWGFGVTFDDGIVRGGIVTQAERIAMDVVRLGKWTASIKGGLFNIRQLGLQAMNPAVDVDPKTPTSGLFGVSSTLIYNPLTMLANVATARAGVHLARHGLFPFDSDFLNKYEKSTFNRETNLQLSNPEYKSFEKLGTPNDANRDPGGYNRLIGLMKELLPNSFKPTKPGQGTSATQRIKELAGISSISRISSTFGGAQSYFGIGGTVIRRAGHPYLTNYTTSPTLEKSFFSGPITAASVLNVLSQTQPQYLDSAKRDTFYGAINETTYADELKSQQRKYGGTAFGIIKALAYILNGPKDENSSQNFNDEIYIQSQTKNIIKKLNPFNPKYDLEQDRFESKRDTSVFRQGIELSEGPSDQIIDYDSNPIKKYRVSNYDKLKRNDRRRSSLFNDFRAGINLDDSTVSFITDPDQARFDTRNLTDRYGFGEQGEPGAQRNQPYINTIEYKKFAKKEIFNSGDSVFRDYAVASEKTINGEKQKFRGDRINIIDYKRANFNINTNLVYEKSGYTDGIPGKDDLVEFYFSSLVLSGHGNCPAEVIVFRATFDNITDNHNPSWNAVKYMGRADPLYTYQGYEREISFGFTVHIGSRDEMKASWRKLNYLASWTAPEYLKSGLMRGPMIRLNIGHLYRKMPGYISSLSYTFDNQQTTWETAKMPEDMNLSSETGTVTRERSNPGVLQLPKHIQVNVSFVPVGVYRPEFRGIMYSLYDDSETGNNIESGLQPVNGRTERVNYFKEFDDLSVTPTIYSGVVEGYGTNPEAGDYGLLANSIQTIESEPVTGTSGTSGSSGTSGTSGASGT